MARSMPVADQMYEASEVKAMCGFVNDEQLNDAIADARFPTPIQQSRQAPAFWLGRHLLIWLELQPLLHRRERPERPGGRGGKGEEN